jgi:hypothetical protein
MPLFTGPSQGPGSVIYGGADSANLIGKAWTITRMILKRSVQGAVLTLAGNAVYYVVRQLSDDDAAAEIGGAAGDGGALAAAAVPPMHRRDP